MTKNRLIQGILWALIYTGLTLAPLILLLLGPRAPSREFYREFSVALGFAGLSMAGLQFVLTARFRFLSAPYGTDILYAFHRQISILAALLILAHPVILFIFDPPTLRLLNIFSAETPWRARAGLAAVLAMALVVTLSIWRKRIKIEYNGWRVWHGVLATLFVGLGMVHVILVGYHFNTPWKQAFWIAYTIFWIGLLGYTRILRPVWILRNPYIVESVVKERGNSWTLHLKPQKGKVLRFKPGQFAWINTSGTPFAHRDHPFTIASSAEARDRISFTIRELGDFTRTIKELHPGTKIYIEGPYGIFSPDHHPHAASYVFVAGGVGITPAMSALRTLADRGEKRPLILIYANRDWENIIFREEIEELKKKLNLKVIHILERPPENWQGDTGFVTAELLNRELPADRRPNATEVFICGPEPMMDAVEKALDHLRFPVGDFHSERFDLV
ncbi:MAG: oxidoreductase [Anaerolineae bacterium]|nr:oxidoreductase [Anaerolineae bacterium]